jgi:hypothetical protein
MTKMLIWTAWILVVLIFATVTGLISLDFTYKGQLYHAGAVDTCTVK